MAEVVEKQSAEGFKPKIVVITMERSSYLAADALGQLRLAYPANVYIMKTIFPVVLPEYFYLNSFDKGVDGIIVAPAGSDCPIEESFSRLSEIISSTQKQMKAKGLNMKRLRMAAICSVCTSALLKEINNMSAFLIKQKEEGQL